MHAWGAISIQATGYLAALFTFAAYNSKTMVRLRVMGILANVSFIVYGATAAVYPTLLLHAVLLPLNVMRLRQVLALVRQVREAARGDLSVEWLRPFTRRRRFAAGERLWQRGDVATEMLVVLSGRFSVVEAGVLLGAGEVIGEIGLIDPDTRRSQSVACIEDGEALTITYDEVRQLAFQNAKFGFYFLQLAGKRLLRDVRAREAAPAPAAAG